MDEYDFLKHILKSNDFIEKTSIFFWDLKIQKIFFKKFGLKMSISYNFLTLVLSGYSSLLFLRRKEKFLKIYSIFLFSFLSFKKSKLINRSKLSPMAFTVDSHLISLPIPI